MKTFSLYGINPAGIRCNEMVGPVVMIEGADMRQALQNAGVAAEKIDRAMSDPAMNTTDGKSILVIDDTQWPAIVCTEAKESVSEAGLLSRLK
jgi:hypothetical protein